MPGGPYLEISYYEDGRPMIAYLYLHGKNGIKSAKNRQVAPGYVLDFTADGHVIGVELLYPDEVTLEAINQILQQFGEAPITKSDLAPLKVA